MTEHGVGRINSIVKLDGWLTITGPAWLHDSDRLILAEGESIRFRCDDRLVVDIPATLRELVRRRREGEE